MPSTDQEPLTGRILAPDEARGGSGAPRPRPQLAGKALSVGFSLLAVVALIDLALLWWPFRFGNPEWEFGTYTQTIDSLPLVSMMTLGLVVLALSKAHQGGLRFLAGWCWVVVLVLLVVVVLYLLNIPLIWQRAGSPDMAIVMRKAIVKMAGLSVLYLALYGFLGTLCWKGTRTT